MNIHPYWSYGPDQGMPPIDALDEGRRAFALEMAVKSYQGDHAAHSLDIINRAKVFEAYLKGDDA